MGTVYRRLVFVRHLETWSEKQVLHSSFRSKCGIYWRGGLVNSLPSTYIHFVSLFPLCSAIFIPTFSVKLAQLSKQYVFRNREKFIRGDRLFDISHRIPFAQYPLFARSVNTCESVLRSVINGRVRSIRESSSAKYGAILLFDERVIAP